MVISFTHLAISIKVISSFTIGLADVIVIVHIMTLFPELRVKYSAKL